MRLTALTASITALDSAGRQLVEVLRDPRDEA
jgi:hypothetical protein